MPISLFSQSYPPASKFNVGDVPDLSGKVIIVTGGYAGIGKMSVKTLLEKGATVYIAGRDPKKAEAAIKELEKTTSNKATAHFLLLDLGSIKASIAAAAEFKKLESRLDILFNNAGVMTPPVGSKTSDGYELQWGTNVLGHFAFTEELLPLLISTARASSPGAVRIITTSSSAHMLAVPGGVNLEDQFLGGKTKSFKGGFELYGQSKIANVMMAQYWAKQLKEDGIFSASLNPGNIRSELQRHSSVVSLFKWLLQPIEKGPLTQLYAGTDTKEVTMEWTGSYFVPWARRDEPARAECKDEVFCGKVIDLIKKQVAEKS